MNEWMNDGWMNEWWMNEWMNEWMMNDWMDCEWRNEWNKINWNKNWQILISSPDALCYKPLSQVEKNPDREDPARAGSLRGTKLRRLQAPKTKIQRVPKTFCSFNMVTFLAIYVGCTIPAIRTHHNNSPPGAHTASSGWCSFGSAHITTSHIQRRRLPRTGLMCSKSFSTWNVTSLRWSTTISKCLKPEPAAKPYMATSSHVTSSFQRKSSRN